MAIQTEPVVTPFRAEIDEGSFKKAIDKIQKLSTNVTVDIQAGNIDSIVQQANNSLNKRINKPVIDFDFDEDKLRESLTSSFQGVKKFARDTKVELNNVELVELNVNVAKAEAQLQKFRQQLKTATWQQRAELVLDTNNASKALTEAKWRLQNFANTWDANLSRFKKAFNDLWSTITSSLNTLSAISFTWVLTNVFWLISSYEKYNSVLKNSLWSQEEASQSLRLIQDVAKETPFQLNALTESYIKLVNRGFKPTREEIISLGDLAASQWKDFDQLTEALLDAQTGEFERLKEFGVRASQSGDQVSFTFKGVTTTVAKTDEAIRAYILSLGNLQGVSGGMAEQSQTLGGRFSNLQDQITQLGTQIWAALLPFFERVVSWIANFITFLGNLSTFLPTVITALAGLWATLLVLNFSPIIASIGWFLGVLPTLITWITALWASIWLATGWISLLVWWLVALWTAFATNAGGFQDFVNWLFGIESTATLTSDKLDSLGRTLESVQEKIDQLKSAYEAGTISVEEYREKLSELQAQKDKLNWKIDEENAKLQENASILGNVKQRIQENIDEIDRLNKQKELNNQLLADGRISELQAIASNEALTQKVSELTEQNRDLQLSQENVQDIIDGFSAAKTLDELNKQIARAKDVVKANINAARSFIALQELRWEEVDTAALQKFLSTQQEIAKTIDQQAQAQRELIQTWKVRQDQADKTQNRTGGWGWKRKLSAEDEAKKAEQEADKARREQEKKDKEALDAKIKSINDAANAEIISLSRTEKLKQQNAQRILDIDKKRNEEIAKLQGKQDDLIIDSVKKIQDANEKALKTFGDSAVGILKAFEDAIKDSEKKIEDFEKKIKDTQESIADADAEIGARSVEVQKEIADLQKQITEETDPAEKIKQQEELLALEKELALARSSVSKDVLDEANRQDKLSETEKILEKRQALEKELEDLRNQKAEELNILNNVLNEKKIAEEAFTTALWLEISKRNAFLDTYIKKLSEASYATRLWNLWNEQTSSGRFQNAVNNTTNNINVNNSIDADIFLNALVDRST